MTTIAELRELKDGWDSYHAPAPSKEAIDIAERIVTGLSHYTLEVSPFLDGGVIVNIIAGAGVELELTVHNDGTVKSEVFM